MAVFDHLGLSVSDYAQSKAFYEKALAPLGIRNIAMPATSEKIWRAIQAARKAA